MSLVRGIRGKFSYATVAAVVRVDFSAAGFKDILLDAIALQGSAAWVSTENGILLAMPAISAKASVDEGDALTLSQPIEWIPGWRFTVSMPASAFRQAEQTLSLMLMGVSLVSILLAYLLAALFIKSFTGRVSTLARQMQSEGGDPKPLQSPYESKDEIGMLFSSYNRLIDKVQLMMQREYHMGVRVAHAELMALQSQINPHFLYNTLDMVRHLSSFGNTEAVGSVLASLISFYKLSLNSGKEIVPLGDEIAHVKNYVTIQQFRFPGQIDFHLEEMPEAVMQLQIPKITLQPLVENAITHGILENPMHTGAITLSAAIMGDKVHIHIADDGVGADIAQLGMMISGEKGRDHYGLYSIQQRLALLYGAEYGLTFAQTMPSGVTVTITLPLARAAQ
jgi:two-component system sensor histidine kinase YesM